MINRNIRCNLLAIPYKKRNALIFTLLFSLDDTQVFDLLCSHLQVPSYISRSVAGSYDNEAVAIFALIFTFYLYIKVMFCGLFWSSFFSRGFFYTVYAFVLPTLAFCSSHFYYIKQRLYSLLFVPVMPYLLLNKHFFSIPVLLIVV